MSGKAGNKNGALGGREAAAGIERVEGYLFWQAQRRNAEAEAERFCDRLPWLTDAQRREAVRVYAGQRLTEVRMELHTVVDHYERARRRIMCRATATVLVVLSGSFAAVILCRVWQ